MPSPIFDSALLSMCMTWRHDFGLLDRKEQIAIRKELLGLYERHVKPAIIRAKAAEFTAHTFSIACDAHKRRAERAESILLDESMDHKTHGFCDCPLCKFAESIAPPADASKMGGERGYPYGHCPICGAPGVMRERRPNGDDRCAKGHTYPSKEAEMEQKS